MSELSKSVKYLRSDNKRLEAELMEITLMTEKIDQSAAEERNALVKRLTVELEDLKKVNQLVKVSYDKNNIIHLFLQKFKMYNLPLGH